MEQLITRQDTGYSHSVSSLDTTVPKPDQMAAGDAHLSVELGERASGTVTVPSGFITDFHSVCRPFCGAFGRPTMAGPTGRAMVHDWLYMHWEQYVRNYPELDVLQLGGCPALLPTDAVSGADGSVFEPIPKPYRQLFVLRGRAAVWVR